MKAGGQGIKESEATMKTIYVAGPISDQNPLQVLANINAGIEASAYLVSMGFAVFCPFLDFQYFLTKHGQYINKEMIQQNSLAFVDKCDVMLVLPRWKSSSGTKREAARARSLGMPVYFDIDNLVRELCGSPTENAECG